MNNYLPLEIRRTKRIFIGLLLITLLNPIATHKLYCQQANNVQLSNLKFFSLGNLEVLQNDLGPINWFDAKLLEEKSNNGWRIPNRKELRLLFEHYQKLQVGFEPKVYWSSEGIGENAWAILFRNGEERTIAKKNQYLIRLVRFSSDWLKIKNREDSIKIIQLKIEKINQRKLDSISQIKRRRLDSIATVETLKRERLAKKQKQIEDSIKVVQLRQQEILEKKELYKTSLRLNYIGFGLGFYSNQNSKFLSQSSNKVWSFLTNPNQAIDGEIADGQGLSSNMVIGVGIFKNLGLEVGWESKSDGSVEIKDQTGLTYLSESKSYKLLKQTSFYGGPQVTLPIAKSIGLNFDIKYQILYSRAKINDVLQDPIATQISSATGSNLGFGFRFSFKGLNDFHISDSEQEQIQIGYEKQKVVHVFDLGDLPLQQNLFFVKYIYTFGSK